MKRIVPLLVVLFCGAARAIPTQLSIQRIDGGITIDGDLSENAWTSALRLEQFVEYWKSDNTAPPATTVAFLAYDGAAVYVGFRADDPRPGAIRAPYVDRDKVLGDQDYVAVLIDTQNDRRSAIAFRVNPRGIVADSVVNDANGVEDFAPDFYFEAVARPTETGWTAEMRIPLSSLRYPASDPQTWGVILMRNYPRDYRYIMANTPIPKGSGCFVCHASALSGLEGLPSGAHYTLAPYTSAGQEDAEGAESTDTNVGFDLKWNAGARLTIDATVNPDFSQVESDVPQISTNTRFALSVPEKRTFFLESVDLLATPLKAVHTRSINAPAWGMRATGQSGATAYTLLVGEDRGGGTLILPGVEGSKSIVQDYRSQVLIGRVRRTFGKSFGAFLVSAREMDGGGHNRVIGPDFLWMLNGKDRIVGQLLLSSTENPNRPDLDPALDGSSATGYASRLLYTRDANRYDLWSNSFDHSDTFRADNGFMPFVGGRGTYNEVGLRFYPKRFLSYLRPYLGGGLETTWRAILPGAYFQGKWGSEGWVTFHVREAERVNGEWIGASFVDFTLRGNPWRVLPMLQLEGKLGERIDYATATTGRGGMLALTTAVRPTDHLQVEWKTSQEWIEDVYTAQVNWLKTTYTFTPRSLVRLIAEHSASERDGAKDANLGVSGLYGYRLNWQTTFFVGYGDAQELRGEVYERHAKSVFAKISYAFQR